MTSTKHAVLGLVMTISGVGSARGGTLNLTPGLSLNRNTPFNLMENGSFEVRPPGLAPFVYWATGTNNTPFAVPGGWISGGGPDNYAYWGNTMNTTGPLPDGVNGLYFGNQFASSISETPTFKADGTVLFASPPSIVPKDSNYTPAVTYRKPFL